MFPTKKGGEPSLPNTDTAGPSHVISTGDRSGFEVLDKALKEIEKQRMEAVIKDIDDNKLPMLEDTEEPPELNLNANLSEEAVLELIAEEEKRLFLKDIRDLTFWEPEPEEKKEDILARHLKQVLHKQNPETASASTSKLLVRPGIQRQGTFEIKRKNENKNLGSGITTKGAASSQQTQARTEMLPVNPQESPKTQEIINQVGDLLMELSTLNQQGTEGTSYSYMITVSPANGASNCIIQAVNGVNAPIIEDMEQPHSQPVPDQNPKVNVYAPSNRRRPEAS